MDFCETMKRRFSTFLLFTALVSSLALGGCAQENSPDSSPSENAVYSVPGTDTAPAYKNGTDPDYGGTQAGETQTQEQAVYRYRIEELCTQRGDNKIYGVIYIPQGAGEKIPAVIYSHGYGMTHESGLEYAEKLAAAGYVVYCFDFCGGGDESQSDGSPLTMSVFTEQADLEAVIQEIQALDYVDEENLFLFGDSQGGLVSAITAADNKDSLQGLILLYPAFSIPGDVRALFPTAEDIPDRYPLFSWMTVGRPYYESLLDYDVYSVIGAYDKDVLLIHGDEDKTVDISSSQRALEVYPSAELKVIPGAGHGLHGEEIEEAVQYMLEYLGTVQK